MEEKIRVNLSKRTYDLLLKDTENFEFYKKDGSLNKNAFINRLITSYQKDYSAQQKEMLDIIEDCIFELNDEYSRLEDAGYDIINKLNIYKNGPDEYSDVHISFRPIKESMSTIDFIENHELRGMSRSNYYRNMFDSYCSLPQDKRERIIFRSFVERIEEAIEEDKKIYLLSKNNFKRGHSGVILSPYRLSLTKEELYNYLLAEMNEYSVCRTMRLCRIQTVRILNEKRSFSKPVLEKLQLMEYNGPQYPYEEEETGPIVVKMNEEGIRKFRFFYIHRPVPISIKDDLYYFSCSYMQAINYFSRFGKDAIILSPKSLRKQIQEFYMNALKEY